MPRSNPVTAPDLLLEESFHGPSDSSRQAMPRRGHIVDGSYGDARARFSWKLTFIVLAVVALGFLAAAYL